MQVMEYLNRVGLAMGVSQIAANWRKWKKAPNAAEAIAAEHELIALVGADMARALSAVPEENIVGEIGAYLRSKSVMGPPSKKMALAYREMDSHAEAWPCHRLTDLVARKEQPKINWTVERIVERNTQIAALPHCFKSYATLAGCIEACAEGTFWGFRVPGFNTTADEVAFYTKRGMAVPEPGFNARFIETEDSQEVVETRIAGLLRGLKVDKVPAGFTYCCPGPFDVVKDYDKLLETVLGGGEDDDLRPGLVVISTLQGLIPGRNIKEQDDMAEVNSLFVRLSEYCPLILLTHSPWDKKVKRGIGSVTQQANFGTCLHFEKKGLSVSVSEDSKHHGNTDGFKLKAELGPAPDGGEEIRRFVATPMTKAALVAEYVAENPDATPAEIAEAVGCTERYARGQLKKK